jgi:hypothetical protein
MHSPLGAGTVGGGWRPLARVGSGWRYSAGSSRGKPEAHASREYQRLCTVAHSDVALKRAMTFFEPDVMSDGSGLCPGI